ncbi:MAG: C40 family peptidase [Spirochaetia bacterium]|nr:C40 family peptidase [Spirochaetia bacterium]
MKYDDLIGIPFRQFGRDKSGMDCYGLVLECCRRSGRNLIDLRRGLESLPADLINDYISRGMNVRQIRRPEPGCIVCTAYRRSLHIGYMTDRQNVLHATFDKGVRLSPLAVMRPIAFYEVIDESEFIQGTCRQEHSC